MRTISILLLIQIVFQIDAMGLFPEEVQEANEKALITAKYRPDANTKSKTAKWFNDRFYRDYKGIYGPLDSILSYSYYYMDSSLTEKQVFRYDNETKLIRHDSMVSYWSLHGKKERLVYYKKGRVMLKLERPFTISNDSIIFEYDENGRLIKRVQPSYRRSFEGEEIVLNHVEEYFFEYNEKGYVKKEESRNIYYRYLPLDPNDTFAISFEYTYDLNGRVIDEVYQSRYSGSSTVYKRRIKHHYHENGLKEKEVIWVLLDDVFIHSEVVEFRYNENNLLTLEEIYYLDGNDTILSRRDSYEYNNKGLLTVYRKERCRSGQCEPFNKVEKEYDQHGNCISYKEFINSGEALQLIFHETCTFEGDRLLEGELKKRDEITDKLELYGLIKYDYFPEDLFYVKSYFYSLSEDNEVSLNNKVFYYSSPEPVEKKDGRMERDLKIYPMPAHSQIFIQHKFEGKITVSLYDMSGSCILQKTKINPVGFNLNVEDIEPGVYFLNIKTSDNHLTKKILIK